MLTYATQGKYISHEKHSQSGAIRPTPTLIDKTANYSLKKDQLFE